MCVWSRSTGNGMMRSKHEYGENGEQPSHQRFSVRVFFLTRCYFVIVRLLCDSLSRGAHSGECGLRLHVGTFSLHAQLSGGRPRSVLSWVSNSPHTQRQESIPSTQIKAMSTTQISGSKE